ncbi:unnamed protein product, partial [Owenia fusiformis]
NIGDDVTVQFFLPEMLYLIVRIIGLCSIVSMVHCDNVAVKPSDITVNIGDDVTLPCKLAEGVMHEYVSWYEYITKENGFQIFKSNRPDEVKNPSKFAVDTTDAKYDLKIQDVSLKDAGKYSCKTFQDRQRYPAYVTVYEPPSCDHNSGNNIIEGQSKTLTCDMKYSGYAKPILKWLRNGKEIEVKTSVKEHFASANATFVVSHADNGATFTCNVNSADQPDFVGDQCTITLKWESVTHKQQPDIKHGSSHSSADIVVRSEILILISELASIYGLRLYWNITKSTFS